MNLVFFLERHTHTLRLGNVKTNTSNWGWSESSVMEGAGDENTKKKKIKFDAIANETLIFRLNGFVVRTQCCIFGLRLWVQLYFTHLVRTLDS
jgi:hypothetical protein